MYYFVNIKLKEIKYVLGESGLDFSIDFVIVWSLLKFVSCFFIYNKIFM